MGVTLSRRNTPRLGVAPAAPSGAALAGTKQSFVARRISRLGDPPAVRTAAQINFSDPPPHNFFPLAVITSAIGLTGLVRARPLSDSRRVQAQSLGDSATPGPSALSTVRQVWLHHPRGWRATKVLSIAPRGTHFCLELSCSSDRTTAESLVGTRIGVSRTEESEEVYWSDLIGRQVQTAAGEALGAVERLETNGQHDWLVVGRHFIPLVDRHVLSLGRKKTAPIVVDWQTDWLD